MNKKTEKKKNLKRYLKYLWGTFFVSIAVFIVASQWKFSYSEISSLFKLLNKKYLFILFGLQILTYIGDGWLSRMILRVAGFKISLKDTIKVAILDVVGVHLIPFFGGSFFTYYIYKKFKIPSAMRLFLVVVWTFFVWIIFATFFLLALIFFPNIPSSFISQKKISISIIVIIGIFLLIYWIINSKNGKIRSFLASFLKIFNIKIRKFEEFIADFKKVFHLFLRQPLRIIEATGATTIFYLGDIATLYFSFVAFGYHPNFAIIIVGYTISLILPIFTLIPATPGVMEASLVFVFTGMGIPSHVALLSALLFRLFSYWLPLLPGIISFLQLKKINVKVKSE